MGDNILRFIRKNGKIIPIRAAKGAGHVHKLNKAVLTGHRSLRATRAAAEGVGGAAMHHGIKNPKPPVKVNRALDMTGLGLSVASGVLGAATFSSGLKGALAGAAIGHGIDAAGIAANAGSVAGKGRAKDRAKQFAKQEGRNFVIGNAVFAAGIVGSSKNRATVVGMAKGAAGVAKKGAGYAAKILSVARKGLRVE